MGAGVRRVDVRRAPSERTCFRRPGPFIPVRDGGSEHRPLLTERRKPGTLAYSLVAVALLAGAFLHGASYGKQDLTKYTRFRAGVVQPSIPQDMKWDEGFREETMERLTGLSIRLSGESPELLVWPESSIPVGWGQDRAATKRSVRPQRKPVSLCCSDRFLG